MHENPISIDRLRQSLPEGINTGQDESNPDADSLSSASRRSFLGNVSVVSAAAWAGAIGLPTLLVSRSGEAKAGGVGHLRGEDRANQAEQIRIDAAKTERDVEIPPHPTNGDEDRFPNRIGNYSKGLLHNSLGEVDPSAYNSLLNALSSGEPSDFEAIELDGGGKLVNPQAGLAFDLEGTDSHQLKIPPAPAFISAQQAGQMVELYWQALLRDVPFTEYDSNHLAERAAAELSGLTDFRGPRDGDRVTTGTLFRGSSPGDLDGPYISQFLLKATPFGAEFVERRMRTLLPGLDYLTNYADWLDIQNGRTPQQSNQFDRVRRYIRNGRDLAQWVHVDVLFQAYFEACLILLAPPDPTDPDTGGGIGAPLNPGNAYLDSHTQIGFGTFGAPHIATLLCEVATRALKAVWYEKWFVHRFLRPEAFGGSIHNTKIGAADYPIHADVLNSEALDRVFRQNGTYLLPQVYPEGSPTHPSYGAGHATVAGACVTILKAMFDESFVIPHPVVPSNDGLSLIPFADGKELTVGGELNKLAANVAIGRNFAGIHYRADYAESLKLGEAVAISVLRDQRACYNEDFSGFTFTKFDGTTITV